MAERRCFTQKITESDSFLSLPVSTQCLYFHLNMYADDDGFVNSPKKVARMIGANDDDLKLLLQKSFIIVFDSGVIVIKHWRMHNTLRNDRYHPTDYTEEYRLLGLKENKAYTLLPPVDGMATKWQPNGNQLDTEHNITKHNITKHNSSYAPSDESDDAVYRLPLNVNGTYHSVTAEDIRHYQELYPNVDIDIQIKAMIGWLESNPSKRKTKSGVKRFITSWLNREQDRGGVPSRRREEKPETYKMDIDIEGDDNGLKYL